MKRLIVVAALATLAACSQAETAPPAEPAAETAAEAVPAGPVAADGKSSAGTYKITTGDGEIFNEEVKADGTYVQTSADGKVIETGKWNQKSPTEYCTTKDEEGAAERCNIEGIDAKGVWSTKDPEGKVSTVERIG